MPGKCFQLLVLRRCANVSARWRSGQTIWMHPQHAAHVSMLLMVPVLHRLCNNWLAVHANGNHTFISVYCDARRTARSSVHPARLAWPGSTLHEVRCCVNLSEELLISLTRHMEVVLAEVLPVGNNTDDPLPTSVHNGTKYVVAQPGTEWELRVNILNAKIDQSYRVSHNPQQHWCPAG